MKKLLCACLALVMCLGTCFALASCGDKPTPTPEEQDNNNYHVNLVDFQGKPVSDIIVIIETQDGPVMRVAGDDGKVGFELPEGDYTFTLMSPQETAFEYDESACVLTADKKDVTITIYSAPTHGSMEIWAVPLGGAYDAERKAYEAYYVSGGATWVPLNPGDMTYFIYTAEVEGVIRFAMTGALDAEVGYYGSVSFVQLNSLSEIVDGVCEIEVRESNLAHGEGVATPYVIGVYSPSATSGVLNITRKGDNVYIPEVDEPWISYTAPSSEVREYHLHDINNTVATFTNIDVTDPNVKVVYNESDGYYHFGTVDGPVVMMQLTTASPYLAPLSDVAGAALMGKIFYEEDGTFIRKEAYNELFLQRIGTEDMNGCVPLDKYLAHALQNRGDYCGWWKQGTMMYLFGEVNVVEANAWLFACGYYASVENNTSGTEATPSQILIEHINYGKAYATLTAGQTLYVQADLDMIITISDPTHSLTVVYNGTTLTANSSGKITINLTTATANLFTMTLAEGSADVRVSMTIEN